MKRREWISLVLAGAAGGCIWEDDDMSRLAKGGSRRRTATPPGVLVLDEATNDLVSWPSSNGVQVAASAFTVVMLVRPASWPADGLRAALVSKAKSGVSSAYWMAMGGRDVFDDYLGDKMTGWVASTLAETLDNVSRVHAGRYSNPPVDIVSQVAMVFDAGTLKLYVNTNPVKVTTVGTIPALALTNSTAELVVGGAEVGDTVATLDGEVSDVRVYTSALTETQLGTLATTGTLAGFTFRAPLSTGLDDDGSGLTGTASNMAHIGSTPHSPFNSIVRVGCGGDSNMRGLDATFDTDPLASRGGARRHAANRCASRGVLFRGVGATPTDGGWATDHDAADATITSAIGAKVAAMIALGVDVFWVMAGTNDGRSLTPLNTTRTAMRALMEAAFLGDTIDYMIVSQFAPNLTGELSSKGIEVDEGHRCFQENVLMDEMIAAGRQAKLYFLKPGWQGGLTHLQPDYLHTNEVGHELHGELVGDAIVDRPTIPTTSPAHTQQAALISALGSSLKFLIDGREKPLTESGAYAMSVTDLSGNGHTMYAGNDNTLNAMKWTGAAYDSNFGDDDFNYDFMETHGSTTSHTSGAGASFACLFRLHSTTVAGIGGEACLGYWCHDATHACAVKVVNATQEIHFYFDYGLATGYHVMAIPFTKSLLLTSVHIIWDGGDPSLAASFSAKINGSTVAVTSVSHAAGIDNATDTIEISSVNSGAAWQFYGAIRRLLLTNVIDGTKATAVQTYLAAGIGAYDT